MGLGWSPSLLPHLIIRIPDPEIPFFSGSWVVVSLPYLTGLFGLFLIDLWKLFTYRERLLFLFLTYDAV